MKPELIGYSDFQSKYVAIYKMTQAGEELLRRGKKFDELTEGQHYTLFTVLDYAELVHLNKENTLEKIIRNRKR